MKRLLTTLLLITVYISAYCGNLQKLHFSLAERKGEYDYTSQLDDTLLDFKIKHERINGDRYNIVIYEGTIIHQDVYDYVTREYQNLYTWLSNLSNDLNNREVINGDIPLSLFISYDQGKIELKVNGDIVNTITRSSVHI